MGSANLLQKVYFPRLLLPAAATGSYLLDYGIAMVGAAADDARVRRRARAAGAVGAAR